jgi:hypothetical protein
MLPYYLVAAVLVIAAVTIVASGIGQRREVRVASVPAHGTPSPPRHEAASTLQPGPVTGEAPWALSAVPECFRQASAVHGTPAFVAARLPGDARRLPPGSVVSAADCRLLVGPATLTLERGGERLVVPREARAYVEGERLLVLRTAGATADLRVYHRVSGGGP